MESDISTLDQVTIVFVVLASIFFATMPLWGPPAWLGITVGLMTFVIGIGLATVLLKFRHTL